MEKKPNRISLLSYICFLIVLVLLIAGIWVIIYKKNVNKETVTGNTNSNQVVSSVATQNLNEGVQKKNSNSNSEVKNVQEESNTQNTSKEIGTNQTNYSEITSKLENDDLLKLTEAVNNNDGTYTLKGQIITVDKSKEQITEFPFYKETGVYRQITLASSSKCVYNKMSDSGEEEVNDTVENVFSKKLYSVSGQGACFNFTFENGKVVSVNEVQTGH